MNEILKIILQILTAYSVLRILQHYGLFEKTRGIRSLSKDIKLRNKNDKALSFERSKLAFYSNLCSYFGLFALSNSRRDDYSFYIDRLDIKSDILDRPFTAEELRGRELLSIVVAVMFLPLVVVTPLALIGVGLCLFNFIAMSSQYKNTIQDEDDIIDDFFINLYLAIYPKLCQGSKARISKTVESYIRGLEISEEPKVRKVMKKLAMFLLNNLSIYEDHVAVPKLKERYHSAMISNFCNVATQSLQGVANNDILLSLQMDLVRRQKDRVAVVAEKRRDLGARSTIIIYINIFILVLLGWVSKLPAGIF